MLLLRRDYEEEERNVFKPAEWRWTIPQVPLKFLVSIVVVIIHENDDENDFFCNEDGRILL